MITHSRFFELHSHQHPAQNRSHTKHHRISPASIIILRGISQLVTRPLQTQISNKGSVTTSLRISAAIMFNTDLQTSNDKAKTNIETQSAWNNYSGFSKQNHTSQGRKDSCGSPKPAPPASPSRNSRASGTISRARRAAARSPNEADSVSR